MSKKREKVDDVYMSCVRRDDSYESSFSPSSRVMTGLMRSYRYSYASSAYFSEYSIRDDELIFAFFACISLGRFFVIVRIRVGKHCLFAVFWSFVCLFGGMSK